MSSDRASNSLGFRYCCGGGVCAIAGAGAGAGAGAVAGVTPESTPKVAIRSIPSALEAVGAAALLPLLDTELLAVDPPNWLMGFVSLTLTLAPPPLASPPTSPPLENAGMGSELGSGLV